VGEVFTPNPTLEQVMDFSYGLKQGSNIGYPALQGKLKEGDGQCFLQERV